MGWSIQKFEDRLRIINDLDVVVIVYLIRDEMKRGGFPDLNEAIQAWENELRISGPGCFDLRLEEVLSARGARVQLMTILDTIRARLVGSGRDIPASFLNERNVVDGMVFFDFPQSVAVKAIDQFRSLAGV